VIDGREWIYPRAGANPGGPSGGDTSLEEDRTVNCLHTGFLIGSLRKKMGPHNGHVLAEVGC